MKGITRITFLKKKIKKIERKGLPSTKDFVRVNEQGIPCLPNDVSLTQEEYESIQKHGYINYTC